MVPSFLSLIPKWWATQLMCALSFRKPSLNVRNCSLISKEKISNSIQAPENLIEATGWFSRRGRSWKRLSQYVRFPLEWFFRWAGTYKGIWSPGLFDRWGGRDLSILLYGPGGAGWESCGIKIGLGIWTCLLAKDMPAAAGVSPVWIQGNRSFTVSLNYEE